MCTYRKCCCCSLRTGTIIVSTFEFVLALFHLGVLVAKLVSFDEQKMMREDIKNKEAEMISTSTWYIVYDIIMIVGLILGGVSLFVGVFKEERKCLIPFLVLRMLLLLVFVNIVIGLLLTVISVGDEKDQGLKVTEEDKKFVVIGTLTGAVIFVPTLLVSWVTVFSYYHELSEKELRKTKIEDQEIY